MPQAPEEELTYPEVTDVLRSDVATRGETCSYYFPGNVGETCDNDADVIVEFDGETSVAFCDDHFTEPNQ